MRYKKHRFQFGSAITTSSAGELAGVVHGHWEKFLQLSLPITVHQTMNQGPHLLRVTSKGTRECIYMTASGGIHDLVTHRDEET